MQTRADTAQTEDGLPTSPETLLTRLEEIGIDYSLHHHEAVHTVAESQALDRNIAGAHCRNLFLRDKKKHMYLVVALNETALDMKKLQNLIGSQRLSFGSADRLMEFLGVRPGSVCPFAIINDPDQHINVILDKDMMNSTIVNYHPLDNTMTVSLSPQDLLKFIDFCGHSPSIIDLSPAAPDDES